MTRSKYEFYQQASLSQQLSFVDASYRQYAGSDARTSLKIARLRVLGKFGLIDLENPIIALALALLNEERKVYFATSERTNEVTKLGLQMPKGTLGYDGALDK